jgi:hypothetical protein
MKIKCKKSARVELDVEVGVVGVEGPGDDFVNLVTDMELLKGLRSRKYSIKGNSVEGYAVYDKEGSVVAETTGQYDQDIVYSDFHTEIEWPKPGSFWLWVYKTDRGQFFPTSLMCIALVSFFVAQILFKGDIWGVLYLALAASPMVTWIILRSTFVNIRYQKGGIRT